MKLAGIPIEMLNRAFPCTNISLINMPIATPRPPTIGLKTSENIAGTNTAGQNLTTPTTRQEQIYLDT